MLLCLLVLFHLPFYYLIFLLFFTCALLLFHFLLRYIHWCMFPLFHFLFRFIHLCISPFSSFFRFIHLCIFSFSFFVLFTCAFFSFSFYLFFCSWLSLHSSLHQYRKFYPGCRGSITGLPIPRVAKGSSPVDERQLASLGLVKVILRLLTVCAEHFF